LKVLKKRREGVRKKILIKRASEASEVKLIKTQMKIYITFIENDQKTRRNIKMETCVAFY
jgi:hypothetical protein